MRKYLVVAVAMVVIVSCCGWITQQQKAGYYYQYMNSNSGNSGGAVLTGSGGSTGSIGGVTFTNGNTMDAIFSAGGKSGYGLDMMKLIALANPTTNAAKLAQEKLILYVMAENGELDNAAFRMPASVFAAKHQNETSGATFLDNDYLKTENHTLTIFDSSLKGSISNTGGSVFIDNGGDGLPDGPFQFEQGNRDISTKSTLNGANTDSSRAWDVYFFPDNLAAINYSTSVEAEDYNLSLSDDPRLVGMYSSAKHNRGSYFKQAWGIPYDNTGKKVNFSTYVNTGSTSAETKVQVNASFNSLIDTFDRVKPSFTKGGDTDMRALAIYLALCDGWYIDAEGFSKTSKVQACITSYPTWFDTLVPESYSGTTTQYISETYVRNAWDVVGLSKSEYDKIYGTSTYTYYSAYSYTSLFKVEDYTSSLYINKMPNGSDPYVIHVWDEVCLGHIAGSAFTGEMVLLELLIKAGLTHIDGIEIDPNNPSAYYSNITGEIPGTFNPIGGDVDLSANFTEVLSKLGISTTNERMLSLYHVYTQLGTKYWYGAVGNIVSVENYHSFAAWRNTYNQGGAHLDTDIYSTWSNQTYVHNTYTNEDLKNYGMRLYDCAKLAMIGPSLGVFTSSDIPYYSYSTSEIHSKATGGTHDMREVDGVTYDTGIYLASNGNHTIAQYISGGSELVPGGLLPGDILVNPGSHALTYVGVVKNNITLSAELARSDTDVNMVVDNIITFEAWDSREYNRVRSKSTLDSSKFYVVRSYMFNTSDNLN